MIDTENIKKFLPKYLSAESYKELIEGLRCFPENLDSRFYTGYLKEKIIYQGDGIKGFPTINFNTMEKKDCQAIVLSNTCDMDLANKRMFGSQIVYAPRYGLFSREYGICPSSPLPYFLLLHINISDGCSGSKLQLSPPLIPEC